MKAIGQVVGLAGAPRIPAQFERAAELGENRKLGVADGALQVHLSRKTGHGAGGGGRERQDNGNQRAGQRDPSATIRWFATMVAVREREHGGEFGSVGLAAEYRRDEILDQQWRSRKDVMVTTRLPGDRVDSTSVRRAAVMQWRRGVAKARLAVVTARDEDRSGRPTRRQR
jgi:hypothetical protein